MLKRSRQDDAAKREFWSTLLSELRATKMKVRAFCRCERFPERGPR